MGRLLLALLADLVLESAATGRRSVAHEFDRYLERRGLVPPPAPRETPAR